MKYQFTTQQKNRIKKVFSKHYTESVKKFLDDNNIFNDDNKPFPESTIRGLFSNRGMDRNAAKKFLKLFEIEEKKHKEMISELKSL